MTDTNLSSVKVIVFQLQDEEYALPVSEVQSIERLQYITRVPLSESFVKGVINLRGIVTPIIDLRTRFGLVEASETENSRIIICHLDDIEAGLIVDAANDVIDIPVGSIEPPPEVVGAVEVEYIRGVAKLGKRLLILIDLESVLRPKSTSNLLEGRGL